ncbi:hypothetical protein ABPG74_012590 [Tetrahymena malaccensis]
MLNGCKTLSNQYQLMIKCKKRNHKHNGYLNKSIIQFALIFFSSTKRQKMNKKYIFKMEIKKTLQSLQANDKKEKKKKLIQDLNQLILGGLMIKNEQLVIDYKKYLRLRDQSKLQKKEEKNVNYKFNLQSLFYRQIAALKIKINQLINKMSE